jgi:hypothetical protein
VVAPNVTLSWVASSQGPAPTTCVVEVGTRAGVTDLITFVTGTTTTTFAALAPPGVYFVRIRARADGLTSPPSNEVAVVVCSPAGCPPGPPDPLTSFVDGSFVQLLWVTPQVGGPPLTYRIEVGSAPGRSDLLVQDVPGEANGASANGVPSGTYFVRVRARNLVGTSAPSNELQVDVR